MEISEEQFLINRKTKILIVADEQNTATVLKNTLGENGYLVTAAVSSGEAALEAMAKESPDLVLMDIKPEGVLHSIDAAEIIHNTYDLPFIYITANSDHKMLKRAGITESFGYVLKPINPRELNMVIEIALYKHSSEKTIREKSQMYKVTLETAFFDLTRVICRTIEFRDSYTAEHQKRVAELATLVGQRLGLDSNNTNELYIGGMLHDIGKIGVPIGILTKASPLTNTEFMLIKDHARIGYDIIKDTKLPWDIADMIYNHHEKLDGSGYPNGISGDQISRNVRIITVCDVVEAMSTLRPYRKPRTRTEVVDELITNKGIKYDADVVDIMVNLIDSEIFNPWRNYSSDLNYSDPDFPDILVR